ncbi:hypothetical protein HW090_00235 [Pseudomonas sp. ABC1]|uniref:hypothetical protein n=1 Tax=Pseudomonas sp. ABC1 TaxID=2748080 RepID=UPI0015C33051|nr:hypothetical protein [Pseudomonas sp. ABC1]QLF91723.1 hypothetical protein HW090_00235 [Pseudomonas sp. ABC1]
MTHTLRFNDALLITDRAFQPFHCVAWTQQGGNGEVSISVLDGSQSRILGRCNIASNVYSDPVKLGSILQQARERLSNEGLSFSPWSMPA